jgi:hypothetical protein
MKPNKLDPLTTPEEQLDDCLPPWIRPPVNGKEKYTGLCRSALYVLADAGKIKTACIKERGALRGTRLFRLTGPNGLLAYIESCVETPKGQVNA